MNREVRRCVGIFYGKKWCSNWKNGLRYCFRVCKKLENGLFFLLKQLNISTARFNHDPNPITVNDL